MDGDLKAMEHSAMGVAPEVLHGVVAMRHQPEILAQPINKENPFLEK